MVPLVSEGSYRCSRKGLMVAAIIVLLPVLRYLHLDNIAVWTAAGAMVGPPAAGSAEAESPRPIREKVDRLIDRVFQPSGIGAARYCRERTSAKGSRPYSNVSRCFRAPDGLSIESTSD
jgi:hypothetical protein